MKKIVASSTILFSLLVLLQSCSKQALDKPVIDHSGQNPVLQTSAIQIINTNVSAGNTYTLSFAAPSTASITRQASHFLLSETGSYKGDGSISYRYLPEANYKGADEVTLTYTSPETPGSSGCHSGDHSNTCNTSFNYITIKINVTN